MRGLEEELTGELVTTMALGGEELSRMVLGQVGRMLGVGLSNFVNIFNPEVIVIGGGFSQARDLFLEPALETMKVEALAPGRDLVRVVPALLGPDAGLVGAGFVGFEAL